MVKSSPGRYLEKHGDRWRVVVKIPPSLRETFGKNRLKESLPAGITIRVAETLKWPIVAKLKSIIHGAKSGQQRVGLADEALALREDIRREVPITLSLGRDDYDLHAPMEDYAVRRAESIEETHGEATAKAFADIAFGRATPLTAYIEAMCEREKFSKGYREDLIRAVSRLQAWCERDGRSATVEAIAVEVAASYVHETFVKAGTHYKTANKDISSLSSYWKALRRYSGVTSNPWTEQRLSAPKGRHGRENAGKRPFTSQEVTALLSKIPLRRDWDASMIAALSGMRQDEIASLTVADCTDGTFNVRQSKTAAGVRTVPIHPDLVAIVERRSTRKVSGAFLFDELPTQKATSKRGRGAVIAQSFTRMRRAAGVEEKAMGQRQSNVDFHSWRRWFVRTAVDALHAGAKGFDVWTIANVIGHETREGATIEGVSLPLGMTMGVYAGPARMAALRGLCISRVR